MLIHTRTQIRSNEAVVETVKSSGLCKVCLPAEKGRKSVDTVSTSGNGCGAGVTGK